MEVLNNPTPESAYEAPPAAQPDPAPQAPATPLFPVISTGDWFLTILLLSIPFVNIVMLFVWAFDSKTNPNKSAFAKANLIWMAIGIVLVMIFFSTLVAIFAALASMGQ